MVESSVGNRDGNSPTIQFQVCYIHSIEPSTVGPPFESPDSFSIGSLGAFPRRSLQAPSYADYPTLAAIVGASDCDIGERLLASSLRNRRHPRSIAARRRTAKMLAKPRATDIHASWMTSAAAISSIPCARHQRRIRGSYNVTNCCHAFGSAQIAAAKRDPRVGKESFVWEGASMIKNSVGVSCHTPDDSLLFLGIISKKPRRKKASRTKPIPGNLKCTPW